ncbi:putative bifunctional diguanylate cyclase/phosphodiesterase [Virgibacillus kekensis]|uniref:Bifunctional diguanylate cyclase/phosphodiesterase n=1 Tax=Virgibacillus kekensis TaxID=202261 RepID=A0ABV9DDK6_9BACI
MLTTRHTAVPFLILAVIICYGWAFLYNENDFMRSMGSSLFSIIGGAASCVWLFQTYQRLTTRLRVSWLLMSVGVLLYIISNFIWLVGVLSEGVGAYPEAASIAWLLANLVFLIGLIYKTHELSLNIPGSHYIFNIIVFMVTAATISVHYLIKPILNNTDGAVSVSILTLAYPITNLSILFVITILYYLSHHSRKGKHLKILIAGFLLQIAGDTIFIIQTINGTYKLGSYVDLFWLIAILIIGLAGRSAQLTKTNRNVGIRQNLKTRENIFPYAGVILLIILVSIDYNWAFNALSIGLSLVFFMVIARQILVMRQNDDLLTEFRNLAYHDTLTGLSNRTSFQEDLDVAIETSKKDLSLIGLLLIDLDRFKTVNDTLGHHIGDSLLQESSARFQKALGNLDQIYRLGGDEFVIILSGTTKSGCAAAAEAILIEFSAPFVVGEYKIAVTPSIGVSIYPYDGSNNGEDLLKNADAAMYLAKDSGKNNYCFYNAELSKSMARKMEIESELRKADRDSQFSIFYQPKIELKSGAIAGMEALIRWEHPKLGVVSPTEFIPIAEETGQIDSIGEWVLYQACQQTATWHRAGYDSLCIAVNVSVRQFQRRGFVSTVRNILEQTGLPAQYLELEITESIMRDVSETMKVLQGLKKLGVKTSIDDFGTGYSSLHILKELPIDTIKIDKTFISNMEKQANRSMVRSIIDIGLNLNLRVIAEGIESEEQVAILKDYHCALGQGYLYSKPIKAEMFEKLLADSILLAKA